MKAHVLVLFFRVENVADLEAVVGMPEMLACLAVLRIARILYARGLFRDWNMHLVFTNIFCNSKYERVSAIAMRRDQDDVARLRRLESGTEQD